MFGERSEREGNNAHIDVQMLVSIVLALHKSGTPNKMVIFLAYVQNDILRRMDKSNKKALGMLEKAALAQQNEGKRHLLSILAGAWLSNQVPVTPTPQQLFLLRHLKVQVEPLQPFLLTDNRLQLIQLSPETCVRLYVWLGLKYRRLHLHQNLIG